MRAIGSSLSSRVHRRLCLSCGFDGPSLQGPGGEAVVVCPNCGEDLYARPPRSYAELEGLEEDLVFSRVVGALTPAARPSLWRRIVRRLRRWVGAD